MCGKNETSEKLFAHFIKKHKLTLQNLKKFFDMNPGIKLPSADNEPDVATSETKCTKCKNLFGEVAKEMHLVFCQGYLPCLNRDCGEVLKNERILNDHLYSYHHSIACKFGCEDILLNSQEINDHYWESHGVVQCFLCNVIKSTVLFDDHLNDIHKSVGSCEEAIKKNKTKLFKLEGGE